MANPDWVWGAGKAKGGRGKSSSWQDYGGDAKGKGKKGAKGRGKFKGGWSGAQGSEDPDTGEAQREGAREIGSNGDALALAVEQPPQPNGLQKEESDEFERIHRQLPQLRTDRLCLVLVDHCWN